MAATRRKSAGSSSSGDRGSDPVEAVLDELEVRFLLDPETTFERDEDTDRDPHDAAD